MHGKKLLVVESPSKAKTISKYLGNSYTVLSSRGHVRGIPSKSNAINTEQNFETEYEINPTSQKYLEAIVDASKTSSEIYMATDPDREGEAIAWHVVEVIKERGIQLDNKVSRITFNEVTPDAIKKALNSPRELDANLIAAQRTRQALDYLVGFSLSPILWRKLPGSKSAGRVQSVALKILCEREHEIIRFRPQDYWSISGLFEKGSQFSAELTEMNDKKVEKFSFISQAAADSIKTVLQTLSYSVESIEQKEVQRNPEPPFITSTLIQSASVALKMPSKKTMQIAQKLYEGMKINDKTIGLITYMRTDSINVSPESVDKAREVIAEIYGNNYLPKEPRSFKKKVKNAQEAHEAIRPTDPAIIPSQIKEFLTDDEFAVYELIWKKFIACQMSATKSAKTIITIRGIGSTKTLLEGFESANGSRAVLRATGSIILFDGFLKLMSAPSGKKDEDDTLLPNVSKGDALSLVEVESKKHTTTAPSRYSEATLVKKMEDLGIGRPSTYATIISILQERKYVKLMKNKFFVEDRGELVNALLNSFFAKYVEYGFTASLEDELDDIADGQKALVQVLRSFWNPFKKNVDDVGAMQTIKILDTIQEQLKDFLPADKKCPSCGTGELRLKNSKFSPFIGCSNYPTCNYAQKFKLYKEDTQEGEEVISASNIMKDSEEKMSHSGNIRVIGQKDDEEIVLNNGQYGYYLSLGKAGAVQKNFSIGKKADDFDLNFDEARKLFNFPTTVGKHPSGEDVKVGWGRYGPYVLYKKKFYSIKEKNFRDILNFSLEDAIQIIKA